MDNKEITYSDMLHNYAVTLFQCNFELYHMLSDFEVRMNQSVRLRPCHCCARPVHPSTKKHRGELLCKTCRKYTDAADLND